MIKKFALIATVAALFVACSSEDAGTMEQSQPETVNEQEMLDATAAEEDAVVVPATTEAVVIDEAATTEGTATEVPATEVPAETIEGTEPK